MPALPPTRAQHVEALVDRLLHERASWEELIKAIRGATHFGIEAAEKIALSHPGWRRFCNNMIKRDPRCRKRAINHIRAHGAKSLLAKDGDTIRVIESDGETLEITS
jgi:hypothetical protein